MIPLLHFRVFLVSSLGARDGEQGADDGDVITEYYDDQRHRPIEHIDDSRKCQCAQNANAGKSPMAPRVAAESMSGRLQRKVQRRDENCQRQRRRDRRIISCRGDQSPEREGVFVNTGQRIVDRRRDPIVEAGKIRADEDTRFSSCLAGSPCSAM
jgi:hypothetical protein